MGWQSDWLYLLVFAEVRRLWNVTMEQGVTDLFGPPPGSFVIRERAEAVWRAPNCVGPVLREWRYSGATFTACEPSGMELDAAQAQKAFYPCGLIQFHIRGDRQRIAFTYVLGPRYGRGMVFLVSGQGKRGRLELDRDAPGWVS